MNKQIRHSVIFEGETVVITKETINALLGGGKPLLRWQRVYLKSAATSEKFSETQVRVIQGMVQ